ncbi:hypothetical protein N7494_004434 [Penicillium frequentans]|uniref:Uncharacterized protein n=1 Tax=Penicillium frequentans TaxID=3151616 RepID=A0AAD6D1T5_9EURO|nr:hypothetical protein N7494_004434 [Penicillium glabrum]
MFNLTLDWLTLDWQLILINLSILSILFQLTLKTWILSWRIDRLERIYAWSRDIERAANDQDISSLTPHVDRRYDMDFDKTLRHCRPLSLHGPFSSLHTANLCDTHGNPNHDPAGWNMSKTLMMARPCGDIY